MSGSHAGRFDRLRRALAVHSTWLTSTPRPPAAELLSAHPELAELLEPMLAESAPAPPEAPGSATDDSCGDGAQPPPEALPAGTALGAFIVERELGRGAMGVVYQARQRGLGRTVALKVLPPAARLDPKSVARFRRESTLLAALDHPGIVEILTVGRDRGLEFFAMELVDGPPLSAVLRAARGTDPDALTPSHLGSRGASSESARSKAAHATTTAATQFAAGRGYVGAAAQLIARVADALAHAHDAGVLHRDVKPGNVLLRPDGRPVLTDFGLARRDAAGPSLTRTGDFAGTPYYVAPEQVLGPADALDGRSDVFALGVTLYELLTLRRPFDGATNHDVVEAILTSEPLDPRRHHRRVPRELAAVVLKALEKDPDRRYHSARAFADDLEAFLDLRAVQARRPSWPARALRSARREPLRAALIGVLALGTPALTASLGYLVAARQAIEVGASRLIEVEVDRQLQLGTRLMETHSTDAALAAFDRARGLDPGCVEALALQAVALARAERFDEARTRIARTALEPPIRARLEALTDSGDTRSASAAPTGLPAPTTALDHFLVGLRALGDVHRGVAGAWHAAADAFEHALLLADRTRLLHLIHLAHALGHGDAAADRARRVADVLEARWPDSDIAAYWAAFAVQSVDDERYLATLERAIRLAPPSGHRLHYTLGTALLRRDRVDDALPWLRRATEEHPDDSEAWSNLGAALYRRGDLERALAPIERAAALHPGRAMFHSNRGSVLYRLGRVDAALDAYHEAIRRDPDEHYVQHHYAPLVRDAGRVDAAIAFLEERYRAGERARGLFTLLAELHAARADQDAVLDVLERARAAWPEATDIACRHASLTFRSGAHRAALADLADLAERFPGDERLQRTRAELLQRSGQDDAARRALERAVAPGGVAEPSPRLWLDVARARALSERSAARAAAERGLAAAGDDTAADTIAALRRLAVGARD